MPTEQHSPKLGACLCFVLTAWYFAALPAAAIDIQEPAQLRIFVRDTAGRALPNTVVMLRREPREGAATPESATNKATRHVTDKAGVLQWELRHPAGMAATEITWIVRFRVERAGYMPVDSGATLFPGGEIEQQITLEPRKTTLIRLRGPGGQALPKTALRLTYGRLSATGSDAVKYQATDRGRTNERGEYLFVHPPLTDSLTVWIDRVIRTLTDAPEITITLTAAELAQINPPRRVEGKVLTTDGAPAAGWFMAQDVVHTGSGGIFSSVIRMSDMTNYYAARQLVKIKADGVFSVDPTDDVVVVVSPQGIPFMYRLNPRSWPDGARRITLRLPPVRRVQKGRLLYEDGRPAAGIAIPASKVRSNSRAWTLSVGNSDNQTVSVSQARAVDGSPVVPFTTDQEGRYELPLYTGTQLEYRVYQGGLSSHNDLAVTEQAVLKRRASVKPAEHKRITFIFKDERGQRILGMAPAAHDGYAGDKHLVSHGGDYAGPHNYPIFIPATVDRLKIKTGSKNWKPFSQTLTLAGAGDQTIEVVVPESFRLQALSGQVLDPAGRPVAGATISLRRYNPDWKQMQYIGSRPTTDNRGRFTFEAAPDECELLVSRPASDSRAETLPGWSDPINVTSQKRDITIRLQRTGAARVLLPARLQETPGDIYLRGERKPGDYIFYNFAAATGQRVLRAPYVRPGRYVLASDRNNTWRNAEDKPLAGIAVEVQAGAEATIDVRDYKPTPPAARLPHEWINIRVSNMGQPVSGASVTIFTKPEEKDKSAAWAERSEMPLEYSVSGSGDLVRLATDLSDDGGSIRFSVVPGWRYIAVARVPGRLIGWQSFTAQAGRNVEVATTRARTLVVNFDAVTSVNGRDEGDTDEIRWMGRKVWLSPSTLPQDEAAALNNVLGLARADARATPDWYDLSRDTPLTHIAEDLPVNQTYRVQIRQQQVWLKAAGTTATEHILAEKEVTLADDDQAIQELHIETPRAPKNP